jgi:hypothetical protein
MLNPDLRNSLGISYLHVSATEKDTCNVKPEMV